MTGLADELDALLLQLEQVQRQRRGPQPGIVARGSLPGFLAAQAGPGEDDTDRLHLETLRLTVRTLQTLTTSIGECQEEDPFASIRYIFKDGKQYRCCTHKTPHCYEVK